MNQTIFVNIPHKLGKAEAKRRIQHGFGEIEGRGLPMMLSFDKRWDGDQLYLKAGGLGQTISAVMEVFDDSIKVNIDVPIFLSALAELIKSALTKETVKALGGPPSA